MNTKLVQMARKALATKDHRLARRVMAMRRKAEPILDGGFEIMVQDYELEAEQDRWMEEFPEYFTDGEINDEGRDVLTDDASKAESNALKWFQKTFVMARDEGHSNDALTGTLSVDLSDKNQVEHIEEMLNEPYSDGNGDLPFDHEKGLSDFGASVLSVDVGVFDFDEDDLYPED